MATCFVPTEEIRKLTKDSFENVASRLALVLEKNKSKVFGEDIAPRLLGTFLEYVVVGSGDGRFARVGYETLPDGSFGLKEVELLQVPIYSDENIDSYIGNEAKAIAETFLDGKADTALPRLLGLIPFVGAFPKKTDAQVVEGVIESFNSDRQWKQLFKEKQEVIRSLIGEELEAIQKSKLEAKFKALVKGSIPVEKHENYRDLVNTSFKDMATRVSVLIDSVEASMSSVALAEKRLEGDEPQALVAIFKSFSEDLVADLKFVKQTVTETITGLSSVANLGCLYDVLAEELIHYEVASRFVVKMAAKLC